MKKILLKLGTLSIIAIPVTMTISCGNSSNVKNDNHKKINTNDNGVNFMPQFGATTDMSVLSHSKNTSQSSIHPKAPVQAPVQAKAPAQQKVQTSSPYEIVNPVHVLTKDKEMGILATGQRTKPVDCWHVTLDQAHLDNAAKIRKYMNNAKDIQWHTYGDPIVDGINAVRLAIKESIDGNQTLKHMIRDFADNGGAVSNPGNGWYTDNRVVTDKDVAFKKMAKKQINDWFDKDAPLVIVKDIPGWANIEEVDADAKKADPTYDKFRDPERYKMFEAPTAKADTLETLDTNYAALTIGTPELLTAQHRAQECDWLGQFDGHDHGGTMKKIKDGVDWIGTKEQGHATGELSKPPTSDEGFKGEDYMFPFIYNEHTFEEGSDFVSGLLTAINVLYDTDDGSATTGHRTNFYSQSLTTIGWSRHASNDRNFQYIFTEAGKEQIPGTATAAQLKSHKGMQLEYDNPLSSEEFNKIKAANPFFNEYTLEALKYLPPMKFLNDLNTNKDFIDYNYRLFMDDKFGTRMINELYQKHTDDKDFEAKMQKISSGFGDIFDFTEKTKFEDYPRYAKRQVIGQPDTFVKTYNYNGGSTITGEQYGISQLDSKLFEF